MAERNRATVRIYARIVVGDAKLTQHRQTLRGEGFVQLDHIHLVQRQASQFQYLVHGGYRADAHHTRCHACGGHGDHTCFGLQTILRRGISVGQQQCARAIVHA